MLKKIFYCTRTGFFRFFSDSKTYVILLILLIFNFYVFSPFYTMAQYYQTPVSPWLFPMFLSWFTMSFVHGGLCILLFVDIPHQDRYVDLEIIRCGRAAYIIGQILYVFAVSLFFTLASVLFSILFILPVMDWTLDWGIFLRTFLQYSSKMQQEVGVSVSVLLSGAVIEKMMPLQAMLISFVSMWMVTAFMGMVILFFRIVFGRESGLPAAGVSVAISVFAIGIGQLFYGAWLKYLSPLLWTSYRGLDWFGNGRLSIPYAAGFLAISMSLMGIISILRFCKMDMKE